MALLTITPPAIEPLTLAEAKDYLRIDHTEDDSFIGMLIAAARQYVEERTGRRLIAQTVQESFDGFPRAGMPLWLSVAPVLDPAATVVRYRDADGVLQTFDASSYITSQSVAGSAAVQVVGNAVWPSAGSFPDAVQVEYRVGYGADASDVPDMLRVAMLIAVADMYETRAAVVRERETLVDALLWPYKLPTLK